MLPWGRISVGPNASASGRQRHGGTLASGRGAFRDSMKGDRRRVHFWTGVSRFCRAIDAAGPAAPVAKADAARHYRGVLRLGLDDGLKRLLILAAHDCATTFRELRGMKQSRARPRNHP